MELVGVAQPRRPAGGESAGFEHVIALTAPSWRFLAAVHVQLLLALGDIGQSRPQTLVIDNGALIDLLQPVEGPVGQVDAPVAAVLHPRRRARTGRSIHCLQNGYRV